jgi:molecular chaperone GrpE (heat shock protein)
MAAADNTKELKTQIDSVKTNVSSLRDDLMVFQSDFNNFKTGVTKDLKNIIEYLGKQKNK